MHLFHFIRKAFQALVGVNQPRDSLTQVTVAVACQFAEFPISIFIEVNLPMYHAPSVSPSDPRPPPLGCWSVETGCNIHRVVGGKLPQPAAWVGGRTSQLHGRLPQSKFSGTPS
jgi:hypothetical protein